MDFDADVRVESYSRATRMAASMTGLAPRTLTGSPTRSNRAHAVGPEARNAALNRSLAFSPEVAAAARGLYPRTGAAAAAAAAASASAFAAAKPASASAVAAAGLAVRGVGAGAGAGLGAAPRAQAPANLADALLDVPSSLSSYVGEPDWEELAAQDRQYRSWAASVLQWREISLLVWAAVAALAVLAAGPLVARPSLLLSGVGAVLAALFRWQTLLATPLAAAAATALLYTRMSLIAPPRAVEPLGVAVRALLSRPFRALMVLVAAPLLACATHELLSYAAALPVSSATSADAATVAAQSDSAAAAVPGVADYVPLVSAMDLPIGDPSAFTSASATSNTNTATSNGAGANAYAHGASSLDGDANGGSAVAQAPWDGLAAGATVAPAPRAERLLYIAPSHRLYVRSCLAVTDPADPGSIYAASASAAAGRGHGYGHADALLSANAPVTGVAALRGAVPSLAHNPSVPLPALLESLPVAAAEVEGVALLPVTLDTPLQLSRALALLLGLVLALRGALTDELALSFHAVASRRARLPRLARALPAALAAAARDAVLLALSVVPLAALQSWLLPRAVALLHGGALFSLLPIAPARAALAAEPVSGLFAALLQSARVAATGAAKAAFATGGSPASAAAAAVDRVVSAAPAAVAGGFAPILARAVSDQTAYARALQSADAALPFAAAADAALRARVFAPLQCAAGHALYYVPQPYGLEALSDSTASVAQSLALLLLVALVWHLHSALAQVVFSGALRFGRYLLKGLTDSRDKALRHLAMLDLAFSAQRDQRARGVFFSRLDDLPLWPGSEPYAREQHARLRGGAQAALAAGVSVAAFASTACLTSGHRTPALWRSLHDVLIERLIHNTTRKVYRHLYAAHQAALDKHLALARAAAASASGAAPPPLELVAAGLAAPAQGLSARLWTLTPQERLRALLCDHALVAAAVRAATDLVIAARDEDVDNTVGAAQSAQALADALAQLELALRDLDTDPILAPAVGAGAGAGGLGGGAVGAEGEVVRKGAVVALGFVAPRAGAETALMATTVRTALHRLLAAYRERLDEWSFAPAVAKHLDAYLRFEM